VELGERGDRRENNKLGRGEISARGLLIGREKKEGNCRVVSLIWEEGVIEKSPKLKKKKKPTCNQSLDRKN